VYEYVYVCMGWGGGGLPLEPDGLGSSCHKG